MKTRKKTKDFDCVEMMHRGAERVRELTRDMTLAQEAEFWRKETEKLREWQRELRDARKVS